MKPVDQDQFGKDGNCLMACVASILEIPLDECRLDLREDWWGVLLRWFRARSMQVQCFYPNAEVDGEMRAPKGYTIATGDGPRGHLHCVVCLDGHPVHDPHPDKTGIQNVRDFIYWLPLTATPLPRRITDSPKEQQ